MKAKRLGILMGILCLTVALTLAYTMPAQAAKAPKEIVIGAVCSLSGMFAGFGEGSAWGLQAAIDDIKKQGGLYVKEYNKKLPIRLVVVNSESDPVKTIPLAENLILRDKVNFLVVGGEPPTTTSGVSNAADKYEVPFISCCGPFEPWKAMKDASPRHWKYTWACGTFAIATPAPAGDFRAKPGYTIVDAWKANLDLFGDQTNKKVAVFASDDPDGIGWYGLFPKILKDIGYEPVGVDKKLGLAPVETTDFSSIINEWKKNKCEILWGNAPAPFFATMWKQSSTLGFDRRLFPPAGQCFSSKISLLGVVTCRTLSVRRYIGTQHFKTVRVLETQLPNPSTKDGLKRQAEASIPVPQTGIGLFRS